MVADNSHKVFGFAPTASASAPGRVNLIGEHIDYNGGTVLPAGLPNRVHVGLSRSDDAVVRIHSFRFDGAVERQMDERPRGDWTDYALGGLAKCAELGWIGNGAWLSIESNVPDGAGVSSSAALLTAVLRAGAQLAGEEVSPVELAKAARAIENDFIGVPCGMMDQMAVGLADEAHALALNTADLGYELITLPEDWAFTVIHSGVQRKLSDGRYADRFAECEAAAKHLGAQWLCRLNPAQMQAAERLPEPLRKRTHHVVSEHVRSLEAVEALKGQELDRFADLMNESFRSYSADFEASTPEIDDLVLDAIATGARGARLTGGGFGGAIVALLPKADLEDWLAEFLPRHPNAWRI